MKRLSFIFACAASLVMAASCAKESTAPSAGLTNVNVLVTPEVITRATTSDGSQATDLYAAVYDQNGVELEGLRKHIASASYPQAVQFQLVKEQSYKIVFLAQTTDAYLKDGSLDMTSITLPAGQMNSESLDLFTAVEEITVAESVSKTVTLKRPFARVNFVSSEESITAAAAAGFTVSSVKASFTNLPEKYNALEKTVSGTRPSVEYAVSTPCDEAFKAGYKTIAYAYVPVGNGDNYLTDATLVINDGARTVSVTSLPIKANYRTNIIGDFFTSAVNYSVTIDGTFTDATEVEILTPWDGTSTEEPAYDTATNTYTITCAEELAALSGKRFNEANATIDLQANIDFGGHEFVGMIGVNNGITILKGNNKTISNIKIVPNPSSGMPGQAGLFVYYYQSGYQISNLTIENAECVGTSYYAAILCPYVEKDSIIENVTIKSSSVSGDKNVGGIVGLVTSGNTLTMSNCRVENSTINATVARAGGLMGRCVGSAIITNSTVSGNTVTATDATTAHNLIGERHSSCPSLTIDGVEYTSED